MYNQALEAEARGLDNICGVGFRRSLEFLIKDYVKKGSRKEDADAIERSPLGACIGQYVSDPVKSVAKRAAWLGNDETHYVRKWEDKDLKDLKTLIDLTVTWITSELLTDELVASMPEQAKPAP
jgi:hypothetical protein